MIKITNISGANLPLPDGGNLGPNQTLIVQSVPRSLQSVIRFLRLEPVVPAKQMTPSPVMSSRSRKKDKDEKKEKES